MLGFPIDQRVQVVDTIAGSGCVPRNPRQQPDRGRRWPGAGLDRVTQGRELPLQPRGAGRGTGKVVWKKDGYDLRTSSGAGCEQRGTRPARTR